ncbi:hypothetical protein D3C72_1711030 [compost metagenome]
MEQLLTLVGETRGAIRHQTLALSGTNGLAQVGLAGAAEFALAALGGIQRDHMIAHCNRSDAFTHRLDDGAAFVPQDRRKDTFRVRAGQGVGIGVADTAGDNAQQHFASLGHGHVDFDDLQRFLGLEGNSGTGLDHQSSPARGQFKLEV